MSLGRLSKLFSKCVNPHMHHDTRRNYVNKERPVKGVVLGIYLKDGENKPKFTASAQKFDERIQGKLSELIDKYNVTGKKGVGKVFSGLDKDFNSIALVGIGKEGAGYCDAEMIDEGMENARVAAGVGARTLQKLGCTDISVDAMNYPEQAAEGAALALWRYNSNRNKADRTPISKLELYDSSEMDSWTRGLFKAESQNLARRLCDTPSNQMTPTLFAQAAVDVLCPCGITVEVHSMDWLERNRINSFLMIARGSCEPPALLEITYCGTNPEDKPCLLVGKGMTYNSGGLCLRPKRYMAEYRGCMAGAAVCVATMRAAAALSLPINITAIIPLCENMPSGTSIKPGDLITLSNGKTLCVRDTSHAGIAFMADPILYGQNTYKPKLIVDVATLGTGVVKSLGGAATGLFTNSEILYKNFAQAGALTGDRIWRLPLWNYYKYLVKQNKKYDLSNIGIGSASACLGAAILHDLIPCIDWAHLDIRGVGVLTKHGTLPYLLKNRMTGRPTRTLIQFFYQMAC